MFPTTTFSGMHLGLAKKYHLPLFLHSRAAHADFVKILREEGFGENGGHDVGGKGGVVHSFTGSIEEVKELVSKFNVLDNINHVALTVRWRWDFTLGM